MNGVEIIAIVLGFACLCFLGGIWIGVRQRDRYSRELSIMEDKHQNALSHLSRAMFKLDTLHDTHSTFANLAKQSIVRPVYAIHSDARKIALGKLGRPTKKIVATSDTIADTALHSAQGVERFILASDLEAKQAELSKTAVELRTLLRDIIDELEDEALEAETELVLNEPQDHQTVLADHDVIRAAITELITNALVHARARRIDVSLMPQQHHIAIVVADNGRGMSSRTQSRAKERFFTTDSKRRSGLGLYFASTIAKTHGGMLELKSHDDQPGTTVVIRLPQLTTTLK